jgi:hypothetical protein
LRRLALRFALVAGLAMLPAVAIACDSSSPTISKIFKAPPWQGAEDYTYNLVDQGQKVTGTCQLKTTPGASGGETKLEQLCANPAGDRDDREISVDSQTLRPIAGTRTIFAIKKNSQTVTTSAYDDKIVHFKITEGSDVHTAQRNLPVPSKDSPDPGYYDDESLFWVVRGVPLEKGFSGAYQDINASNGQSFVAKVDVQDQETVNVPAGTFNAWKIRLETASITQYFWIDVASPHAVVQADIEDTEYQLVSAK